MDCRSGCGACCIAPSISSPIPGMPQGKPAGVRCVQLTHDLRCAVFGQPGRPACCAGLSASAEGVETEDEAVLLYSLDVDEIQGYWMARPQTAEAVERLFDQPTLLDPATFMQRDALPVVLLVEDEEVTLRIMENLLVSFGVKVVSASSAEQAVELFHKYPYAVAIVDHWLPGENGIQLLGQIRRLMPQTVRVLVTASNDPHVLRDAINVGGAAHFLSKPVDPEALRNVILDACWSQMVRHKSFRPSGY